MYVIVKTHLTGILIKVLFIVGYKNETTPILITNIFFSHLIATQIINLQFIKSLTYKSHAVQFRFQNAFSTYLITSIIELVEG